jgi:hypothetical protein
VIYSRFYGIRHRCSCDRLASTVKPTCRQHHLLTMAETDAQHVAREQREKVVIAHGQVLTAFLLAQAVAIQNFHTLVLNVHLGPRVHFGGLMTNN